MPINYGQGFNESGNRMNIESITDSQGRNVFGTAGGDPYSFDPYTSTLPGSLSNYLRLGADPYELMNTGSFYPQAGFTPDQAVYDPTYGWLAPKSVMDQRNALVAQSGVLGQPDFMSTYGPAAIGALFAGGIGLAGAGAGAAGGSALPFGSALAGSEGAALLGTAAPGGLTASMIPGLGTGVSFGAVPGATLGSLGLTGAAGTFGAEGLFSDLASWGGGAGGDFDPSAVMGNSNGFNPINFDTFSNPLTNNPANPFSTGEGMYNPSQWNTSGFSSPSGGGLANSITPNWLTNGAASSFGADAGIGGLSGSVSGLSGQSSFMDILTNFLGKPQIPGMPGSTGGNLATSLANYFIQSQKQDQLNSAATQAANLNNPMSQTQRLPFQAAYANLMLNPNSYFQTPYAQGMTNQVNQAFQANVGKYGPSGTVFSDYLKNYQNVLGQDYFKLASELGMAGGFNQGTGGAGTAYGTLAGQAANAGSSAFEGFGKLFSNAGSADNTQKSTFQITQNPASGSFTIST